MPGDLRGSDKEFTRLTCCLHACTGITKSPSVSSISEELALSDFMSKYSKSLPHRVKVCKGFYGVSDQTAVTTGDVLNMHFLKSTKVSPP